MYVASLFPSAPSTTQRPGPNLALDPWGDVGRTVRRGPTTPRSRRRLWQRRAGRSPRRPRARAATPSLTWTLATRATRATTREARTRCGAQLPTAAGSATTARSRRTWTATTWWTTTSSATAMHHRPAPLLAPNFVYCTAVYSSKSLSLASGRGCGGPAPVGRVVDAVEALLDGLEGRVHRSQAALRVDQLGHVHLEVGQLAVLDKLLKLCVCGNGRQRSARGYGRGTRARRGKRRGFETHRQRGARSRERARSGSRAPRARSGPAPARPGPAGRPCPASDGGKGESKRLAKASEPGPYADRSLRIKRTSAHDVAKHAPLRVPSRSSAVLLRRRCVLNVPAHLCRSSTRSV